MHQSIATIDSPQFINLQPLEINPLMSECEIKVLYIGENRNHSYITKEVATEMSKTLRGAPIVGYYKPEKEDFADHGERVTLDDEGIHFECMTKPYGFVAPDAKVWFQTFEDYDEFGNSVVREYLMTTGYLWTGQFEECKAALEGGKPQSMELDEATLDGHWSTNSANGIEFFIINDATFSKLCILGDDVEPCFEGASVTAPNVSSTFSMDSAFKNTLFSMMQDLKNFALKGGQQVENLENSVVEPEVQEAAPATEFVEQTNEVVEEVAEQVENQFTEETSVEEEPAVSEFKKEEPEEETAPAAEEEAPAEEEEDEEKKPTKATCDDDEHKKYELLESQYSELQNQYADLESRYNELVEFKTTIENAKKDELINKFYMLSDEDKKDVIENKATYSYDDIEAKLSVICFRKKVNFDLENSSKNEEIIEDNPIVTFNLENTEVSVPAYISALKNTRDKKNI